MRKPSPVFNRLLDHIESMPVIDCHEHMCGPDCRFTRAPTEPILALAGYYLTLDLWTAGASAEEMGLIQSEEATTEEKWPAFSRLWAATEHTAYARVTKRVLKDVYGIEDLTRESLERVRERLAKRAASFWTKTLGDAGIRAIVTDGLLPRDPYVRYFAHPELTEFLSGKLKMPGLLHPAFPLPYFHEIRQREFIDYVAELCRSDITSLDEFEEAMFELLRRSKQLGVVALKDQSAYRRVIAYDLPTRSEAERIFNKLLIDPRKKVAWPEARPLDDYLFHQYMRFARDLDLPVQIHTGHMGRIRNRVDKANAMHLAPVLELHSRVQFDLFHGNWPYMGEFLFLGKNYPNVKLGLCWLYIIDPPYAQELLKRAAMTVPHTKIHGFGGDYHDTPEFAVAELSMARELLASALADVVESGWLKESQAVHMAADWLFNNPNRFYNLGLEPYQA